jgi:exopolysaccharide biosynthesis polyprenyl glycosylphosphotransferase
MRPHGAGPHVTLTLRLINWLYAMALAGADTAMVYLAFRLAAKLQRLRDTRTPPEGNVPAGAFEPQIFTVAAAVIVTFVFFKLYIRRRGLARIDLLFTLGQAILVAFGAALAASSLLGVEPSRAIFNVPGAQQPRWVTAELWRSTIVYWAVFAIGLIWLERMAMDSLLRILRSRGLDASRVLIVGAGEPGQIVLEKIAHAPELGYRVVGFVDDSSTAEAVGGVPILGRVGDVPRLLEAYRLSEIIIAAPELTQRQLLELVTSVARRQVNIKVFPDVFQIMSSEVTTSDLTGLPMMQVRDVALRGWNLRLKRALDLLISSTVLIFISPLLLLLALLIKVTSRDGPVFYVQERVGLDGKPFQLIKFRSMRPDAEDGTGPVWASRDDPRRTRLGALIRRWSLDELPQFVNVLAGEMSLVGPRPERPHFVDQFSRRIPRYAERHNEKAGVTGWAQVNGLRGRTSIEERTKYDVFYVENWSLAFDIKILLKTIGAVFRDRNAY